MKIRLRSKEYIAKHWPENLKYIKGDTYGITTKIKFGKIYKATKIYQDVFEFVDENNNKRGIGKELVEIVSKKELNDNKFSDKLDKELT